MNFLRHIKSLIIALRLKEIFLMTGFSVIGVLFTDSKNWIDLGKDILSLLIFIFFVLAIYCLNSFADYKDDSQSVRLKSVSLISRTAYLRMFVLCTILFSGIGLIISYFVVLSCLLSVILWCFYYLPPIRLKSSLLGGTVIHFLAGICHFHIGYSCFKEPSFFSLCISVLFAMLLSAGHFNHEIIDYDSDKIAGNLTTAVRIGINKATNLRTLLILLSIAYWTTVFYLKVIVALPFIIFLLPTCALLIFSVSLRHKGPELFQKLARGAFLIAGIILLIIQLFKL